MVKGDKSVKATRFVKQHRGPMLIEQVTYNRVHHTAGWKGYVTNIPAATVSAFEVVHDLWWVEQSFRMSKTDRWARPIFHNTREAIEAHLTIVFTTLAVA